MVSVYLCFILQLGSIKRSKVRNVTGLHRISSFDLLHDDVPCNIKVSLAE